MKFAQNGHIQQRFCDTLFHAIAVSRFCSNMNIKWKSARIGLLFQRRSDEISHNQKMNSIFIIFFLIRLHSRRCTLIIEIHPPGIGDAVNAKHAFRTTSTNPFWSGTIQSTTAVFLSKMSAKFWLPLNVSFMDKNR